MASLATFRKMLIDNISIYDVIGQLAGQIIVERGIQSIDIASLRDLINKENGIDVPSSIVKASIKRVKFVTLDNFHIKTNENLTKQLQDEIIEKIESNKEMDQQVYDALIDFVEEKTQSELDANEKRNLIKDFCSFIVSDSYNLKYSSHISNFFIFKKNDNEFLEQINKIREGVIILLGLAYNVKDDSVDILDRPLCLYLETEVLFNMAGYNGKLAQELFDEFFNQITAINKKSRNQLVKLMYFEETFIEIEHYFNTAQDIVEKRTRLDLSKTAMKTIVDGRCEKYEVIEKFGEFKRLLQEKNIVLDKHSNYYDKDNARHNIDHERIIYDIANDEYDEARVYDKISLTYYIYIKRGQRSHEIFNNIGHILVSGNSLTFKVSCHEEFGQKPKDVPLVWGMERITSRLWQMLNKGIIPSGQLKSLDILAKSRIVLSNKVNGSIERLYKKIEQEIKDGRLTEQDARIGVIELRLSYVTPDDINETDIEKYQSIIDEESIENVIAESKARQRAQEEIIISQSNIIKDQKTYIAETDTKKNVAIRKLLSHENERLKRRYDAELERYNDDMNVYVLDKYRKQIRVNRIAVILSILLGIILFFLANICNFGHKWISNVASFVIYIITLYRPIINHQPIKNAYVFLLSKKQQEMVRMKLYDDYANNHEKPKLIQKTEADIESEILSEL